MKSDILFDNYEPECVNIHGEIGCGKTWLAASASQFWPGDKIAERLKGVGKKIELEDCLWFGIDSNAIAGFSIIGVTVPYFSLQKVMTVEAEWKKWGLAHKPSVIEASNRFCKILGERFAKGQTRFGIIDTVSKLDESFINYHKKVVANDSSLSGNKYALWQLNYAAHCLFHESLKFTGANLIYCMHSQSVADDTEQAKKKNVTVLMAGGASFAPAISGKSAAAYKRDATMQLLVRTTIVPGKKGHDAKKRIVITDVSAEGETKNRYGGVLPQETEPDLRKMYKTIRAAQNRWR